MMSPKPTSRKMEAEYSLYQTLKPEVIADPYPLYRKLREFEPVHWDPFLHSWVVTSYAECVTVLSKYLAARTPTPEHLEAMGLAMLAPYAGMMLKQILFMDGKSHLQLRSMCAAAFSVKRMEALRQAIENHANALIDKVAASGQIDLVEDFAGPFPAIVLATVMGLPLADSDQLKHWSTDVAELIGNFEHNPDRLKQLVISLEEIRTYLTLKVTSERGDLYEGALTALLEVELNGERMSIDDMVANAVLMCAGGLEEPSSLIGCGMYSLLERPDQLALLRDRPEISATAVEELIRWVSPTQHTGRLAPEDAVLGGKQIRKGQLVTAVVAAANRDPLRFTEPETLNVTRDDNRHLAFGWSTHYCIGAPLARMTGQAAFRVILGRLHGIKLAAVKPEWRSMAALRGIVTLPVEFDAQPATASQGNGRHVE